MADQSPRMGVFFIGYTRFHLMLLAFAYYQLYRPDWADLHVYLDVPDPDKSAAAHGESLKLVHAFTRLHECGVVKQVHVEDSNRGLTYMVSKGAHQMAAQGYDYICRLEDDILVGPNCFQTLVDAMEQSAAQDERPLLLMGGQVDRMNSVLRPQRFRRVGPYTVGIHGVDNVEGLTVLNARTLRGHQFNWSLDHVRAYNNEWLNRIRGAGGEGGCVVDPTIAMQHIGHRTTVPNGTPICPARAWSTNQPIELPGFDWNLFFNNSIESEPGHVSKLLRELCVRLPDRVAATIVDLLDPDLEFTGYPDGLSGEPWDARWAMNYRPGQGSVVVNTGPPVAPPKPKVLPPNLPPRPATSTTTVPGVRAKKGTTPAKNWTDL